MIVEISAWASIQLGGIVRQQRNITDLVKMANRVDLWKKISIPDSQHEDYMKRPCMVCRRGQEWDKEKLKLTAPIKAELSTSDCRDVIQLLKEHMPQITTDDFIDWYQSLNASMEAALKEMESPARAKEAKKQE